MDLEFSLEYAKLISRHFPVRDALGKLVDYTKINEYQLHLLQMHELYGDESDPVKREKLFRQLCKMDEHDWHRKNGRSISRYQKDHKNTSRR
jgi:hypothetical protein